MAIITPPATLPIRRIQWTLKQPAQVNRSGWTGRRQVVGLPGAPMWQASAEFVPIIGSANAAKWKGFFTSLRGQLNTFPLVAVEENQHGAANPTVSSGGAAGATTLVVSSIASGLKAGQFMTVKLSDGSYQMVQLTADLTTTTAQFLPALRLSAATGAGSLETIQPYCHVALTSDTVGWTVEPGRIYGFAFEAEEAF